MPAHDLGLVQEPDVYIGLLAGPARKHIFRDPSRKRLNQLGAPVVEQHVHASLVVLEQEKAVQRKLWSCLEDTQHVLPDLDSLCIALHPEYAIADWGYMAAFSPDVFERILVLFVEEFAAVAAEDDVNIGVSDGHGVAEEDGIGVEEEKIVAGGQHVDEEFWTLPHHSLEVFRIVVEVLVGGDGVEGGVAIGGVAPPFELPLHLRIQCPEDNLSGIEGGLSERAEEVVDPHHVGQIDGHHDQCVVDGIVGEPSFR